MDHDAKHHGMHGGASDNPSVLHETSDADTRLIIKFGIWLAVLTVASALAVFPVMHLFEWWITKHEDPQMNPMMPAVMQNLPPVKAAATFPVPRLQPDTPGDIARFRNWEREQSESYQVVDQTHGTVRIPVSRAMELTLQRGLPTRGAAPAAENAPAKRAAH